ncbi:MAG: copper resistance protein CopC [Chloroflexi bacterium]|nr:copper resistance protein CopC [Chloroflexota bacterium]
MSLVLILLAALTGASRASAHNVILLRSEPAVGAALAAAPVEVRAWFNEEMQTGVSKIQVFDASGAQVDKGDGGVDLNDPDHASMVVSLPALGEGAYKVRWQVVLLDGDPTTGEFSFYVGAAGAAAATLDASAAAAAAQQAAAAQPPSSSNLLIWGGGVGLAAAALGFLILSLKNRSRKP